MSDTVTRAKIDYAYIPAEWNIDADHHLHSTQIEPGGCAKQIAVEAGAFAALLLAIGWLWKAIRR